MSTHGDAWKGEELVRTYLEGIRGALPFAREQIEIVQRLVRAAGIEPLSVIDLGCGDGVLAASLLDAYPDARAVLVDFSEPMLDAARERLRGLESRCTIAQADLAQEGWREVATAGAPMDVAVSGFAIHHLADERKRALYAEVFELLRPGGFFLNIEHVRSTTPWLESVFDDYLVDTYFAHRALDEPGITREQIRDEYVRRPDREENIVALVEEQCAWLRAIGYQDVDCYFKVFELAVFGGRRPA
jgi:ubiquinone/menaquinone biosynthesis C-methylase UbiE